MTFYHAGFLGKVIDVGNQSIVVRPGPMYRSQRRTYRRYTVNPPIVVGLREAHESSPSIFVHLVNISMGGAAFVEGFPDTSTSSLQGASLPSTGHLFWTALPRPECVNSLELAAAFIRQRVMPGSSHTLLWTFAWQQVTFLQNLKHGLRFTLPPVACRLSINIFVATIKKQPTAVNCHLVRQQPQYFSSFHGAGWMVTLRTDPALTRSRKVSSPMRMMPGLLRCSAFLYSGH